MCIYIYIYIYAYIVVELNISYNILIDWAATEQAGRVGRARGFTAPARLSARQAAPESSSQGWREPYAYGH